MDFKSLKAFPIKNGDNGDKINLPSSILHTLVESEIQFPIIFEIVSKHYKTHCGVIEFTADEGTCFIPEWIMKNLNINEGDFIYIRNVCLSHASFIKFKPELKFLELSDPRAVLEYILRSFSCVTIGDKLHFNYNFKEYILEVIEVKPKKACYIIDADIEVEFDEPDGYIPLPKMVLPEPVKSETASEASNIVFSNKSNASNSNSTKWGKTSKIAHFQGSGNKLS
jgi:ubiquitin fusion degradation protein 1